MRPPVWVDDRRGRWSDGEAVLCAVPRMRPGTVLGACVSLLIAGVLLARGFVGALPSRPVYLVLGGALAGTALIGLVVDHVSVVVRAERPDHLLVTELDRSRRYGHSLTLVSVRCDQAIGLEVVSRLRTTDRAWWTGGRLYLLLVETDRDEAVRFVRRLEGLVGPETVRRASFPTDAVTTEGLYACLDGVGELTTRRKMRWDHGPATAS